MDSEKIKKYSLVEVALLAVFMAGLLISGQIVRQRMRVELSEPIELSGSGLTVHLPNSAGWEPIPVWQYEESEQCMTLIAQLRSRAGGAAEVRWRYNLSTPDIPERELLEMRSRQIGADVLDVDVIDGDKTMVYAEMIAGSEIKQPFILGLMRLEHNRSLELQIKSRRINEFYNLQLLNSLATAIQYETPRQLTQGRAFLNDYLNKGLASTSEEAFLLKDQLERPQGYYHARHSELKDGDRNIRRTQIRQVDGSAFQLVSSLWLNPQDAVFRWKTNIGSAKTKSFHSFEIERDKSGNVTIGWSLEDRRTIKNAQFLLPELLLQEAAVYFVQSPYDTVVIDILSADGKMVPVRLSKSTPDQSTSGFKGVDVMVLLDYLHREDSFEEVLFDADFKVLGKYEQSSVRRIRIWDSISTKKLEELFEIDLNDTPDDIAINVITHIGTE